MSGEKNTDEHKKKTLCIQNGPTSDHIYKELSQKVL